MTTTNSILDKITGGKTSQKAFRTIDLQDARTGKLKQCRPAPTDPPAPECDWRRLQISKTEE
ncbi:hypothetical protein [Roseibium sp. Sym1]|uniref:hypothetical protein n=1 Tax=Roseibium sp. Sym1 TaxID=3016006 RepID=UPI0022B32BC1|nr:hypothetical protein [Roseibium sp. Sym1]